MQFHQAILTATTILFLAPLVTGCSTTATISRPNMRPLEAKIVGSDPKNLYLEVPGTYDTRSIGRSDITDIDHPGNVAAVIGGIVTGYGIANIAIGAPDCDRKGAAYCTGVFLPAAIGAPIFAWGLVTWMTSTGAVKPKSGSGPDFAIVPTASFDKKNEFVGASASLRF
jgi:hypothetical protein